jgi:hypothetical protein
MLVKRHDVELFICITCQIVTWGYIKGAAHEVLMHQKEGCIHCADPVCHHVYQVYIARRRSQSTISKRLVVDYGHKSANIDCKDDRPTARLYVDHGLEYANHHVPSALRNCNDLED